MQTASPIPKNIVLIGFMGCGKSTVGRELRHLLGYPLVDTDAVIESRTGKAISRIFSEDGEAAFRDLESGLLEELAQTPEPRRIIATGGGAIVRLQNRSTLRHLGYVVWLVAPIPTILQRTRRNRDRPLLNTEEPAERIRALLAEREPWYQETSHLKVDTHGLDSREIATGILESARYFFTGHPSDPCGPV